MLQYPKVVFPTDTGYDIKVILEIRKHGQATLRRLEKGENNTAGATEIEFIAVAAAHDLADKYITENE